jgi:EmrB/QacA subfamily drug resistance transporter
MPPGPPGSRHLTKDDRVEKIAKPWPALWSLVIGFFMILIDSTIVSVANPVIMESLGADINSVIWVTSAYLLAYAVPLLITGRLGDRFGPKKLYLLGLVVFTLASLWCGLAGNVETLIAARVLQGLGAAIMTPQTMAVITRIFPPDRRGAAMSIWGATAGMATLVGPILGGVLVDGLGWEWIFFINVPIGIAGFILALRNVPTLDTHPHRFDIPGVVLSAVGLFLVVFGIQEGETYNWGTITGPVSVWGLIVAGLVVLTGFVVWQRFNKGEPLLPLGLFRDRNFSLANLGITLVGFTVTSFGLPLIFYYQMVRGLTPTQSALLMVPMALISGGLAPVVGKIVDRVNPKYLAAGGLVLMAVALAWNALLMQPGTPILLFLLPSAVLGFANAGIWAPLSTTATRNLPPRQAGAGSGVYNTTRQFGAVLGSAAIAVLIQARLAAELPAGGPGGPAGEAMALGGTLPEALHSGFSAAMSQSILLPAAVVLVGAAVALFFAKPQPVQGWGGNVPGSAKVDAGLDSAG